MILRIQIRLRSLLNCEYVPTIINSYMQDRFPHINLIPTIYAATKADLDRQEQRYQVQPDTYTRQLNLQPPIHVSALWDATGDLFVQLAEAAGWPGTAVPRLVMFFI